METTFPLGIRKKHQWWFEGKDESDNVIFPYRQVKPDGWPPFTYTWRECNDWEQEELPGEYAIWFHPQKEELDDLCLTIPKIKSGIVQLRDGDGKVLHEFKYSGLQAIFGVYDDYDYADENEQAELRFQYQTSERTDMEEQP
jgi:hypothetical protein